MLSSRSRGLSFAIVFTCLFGVLSLPWPSLATGAVDLCSSLGNLLLAERRFESGVHLEFVRSAAPGPHGSASWQATLAASNYVTGERTRYLIDVRQLGYVPIAVFVALACATPVRSRRRMEILGLGLLVLVPLTGLLMAAAALAGFEQPNTVRPFELSGLARLLVQLTERALVRPPGMTYAIPGLLWWVLLSRRRRAVRDQGTGTSATPRNA